MTPDQLANVYAHEMRILENRYQHGTLTLPEYEAEIAWLDRWADDMWTAMQAPVDRARQDRLSFY